MKKRGKKIHGNKLTKHHIRPTSRYPELYKDEHNICKVPHKQHDLYHRLFKNMTPEEIIAYLNKTFWNNNYLVGISEK